MMIADRAIEWANRFVGTVENPKNSNRGLVIDDIQKVFGYKGVAYCALFAQYVYKRTCVTLNIPFPFSGTASSQTLYQEALKKNWIETDFKKLQRGDIVIWRKFLKWQGHVGIVERVFPELESFHSIEGNTSPGDIGSQSAGGGIYRRVRYMKKMDFTVDSFYLRGFISIAKVFPEEYIVANARPLENIKNEGIV